MDRDAKLSVRRQCELLEISRTQVYYKPRNESEENLILMKRIDRLHLEDPSAGTRRMAVYLRREGHRVGRKRVRRLMQLMGLVAAYPRKRTTIPGGPEGVRPYLLRDLEITRVNQVWCADITYIPMARGFMYLVCVMDWHSRKILSWELSNTLETDFCLSALNKAVENTRSTPEIFNTDQGCQFTSHEWIGRLEELNIRISMDGKGCWVDNVLIERFWRSIKYENIFLNVYENGHELACGIKKYIHHYNHVRPHEAHNYATPQEVYQGNGGTRICTPGQSDLGITPLRCGPSGTYTRSDLPSITNSGDMDLFFPSKENERTVQECVMPNGSADSIRETKKNRSSCDIT